MYRQKHLNAEGVIVFLPRGRDVVVRPEDIIVYPENVYVVTPRLPSESKMRQICRKWIGRTVNFHTGVFREQIIARIKDIEKSLKIKETVL